MVTVRVRLEDIVGSGKVRVTLPNGKSLDAKIPAGFEPGQQLRLKGQGGDGTPPGDAIAILVYEPHPLFRPDGYNLRLDLPVTLDEAVLGGKVRVPTLEGAVDMTIPAGVTGSKAFRLRGKGLPDKAGNRGDIFLTPRIVLPDGADAGLEKLMERWREVRPTAFADRNSRHEPPAAASAAASTRRRRGALRRQSRADGGGGRHRGPSPRLHFEWRHVRRPGSQLGAGASGARHRPR